MFMRGRVIGCDEGEIVLWVTLVWEGRGLALWRWDSNVAELGGIGICGGGSRLVSRPWDTGAVAPTLGLQGSDWAPRR